MSKVDLKKGDVFIFKPFCGMKMHALNCEDIEVGDKIEIVRKTRRGTYTGVVLRTEKKIGGFIKKDFARGTVESD